MTLASVARAAPMAPRLVELDVATVVLRDAERATLFLHGGGGDRTQLAPLAAALEPDLAILPSLRGHGASPAPPWGYSPLDAAADLQRSAHRWPGRLDVVGYSWGAVVGAVAAVTWAAPRVTSLVVLDTAFGPFPELHEDDEWAEGSWLRWTFDYRPVLAAVGAPVLVVRSASSELVGDEVVEELAGLESVTVVTVPGDHMSVLEPPGTLASTIRGWQP